MRKIELIKNTFHKSLNEHINLCHDVEVLEKHLIEITLICSKAILEGNKIIFCGNGGSAADSQHLAAELIGRLDYDRISLPGIALTTDTSALTSISNDYSFSDIFSRQLSGLGKENDVLISLSTSGNSPNIIKAVKKANEMCISTVSFLGKSGGSVGKLSRFPLIVPHNNTARIQELHILLGHILCSGIQDLVIKSFI